MHRSVIRCTQAISKKHANEILPALPRVDAPAVSDSTEALVRKKFASRRRSGPVSSPCVTRESRHPDCVGIRDAQTKRSPEHHQAQRSRHSSRSPQIGGSWKNPPAPSASEGPLTQCRRDCMYITICNDANTNRPGPPVPRFDCR